MKNKENYIKYFTDNVDEIELMAYVCQAVNDTIRMYKKGNIGMYKNGNIPCTKLYIKYTFNCRFFFVTPMLY